jgi:hypothetical protein
MVRELMRHFGVEDKLDGPIPVWTEATQLPFPKHLGKQWHLHMLRNGLRPL